MPRLGTKVHGQIVLQGNVNRSKIIVNPHIGQWGHIGCRDGAHVEGEVIEHGPDRGQRKGRMNEGIGGQLRLV